MSLMYVYPKRDAIQADVLGRTLSAIGEAAGIMNETKEKSNSTAIQKILAGVQTAIQTDVVTSWWDLASMLLVRYNDYSFNFPEDKPLEQAHIGYPAYWLEMGGYNEDSWQPQWVQPSDKVPALLPLNEKEEISKLEELYHPVSGHTLGVVEGEREGKGASSNTIFIVGGAAGSLVGLALVFSLGRRSGKRQ